jgi:hypothetical protein
MLAFHPDDPSIGDWARAEAERRGVALKVVLEEAVTEYRASHGNSPEGTQQGEQK